MNEKYERAVLEVIKFRTEDVIATSSSFPEPEGEYQVPIR